MTIQEIQNEIINDFSLFDNWEDKYAYIIELGKQLPTLAESHKTDLNKIKGCQSNVWLITRMENNRVVFEGDSDALIVKGLISMLIKVLSNQKPEDISQADLFFIDQIGMKQQLSMTRANGLASMIKQMKLYALAYQSQMNN
ncbi:MAG: SufE family protein [Microscillaceae bacterium]|nr:SufE family protein [Microscillaceae bacterium]